VFDASLNAYIPKRRKKSSYFLINTSLPAFYKKPSKC